MRKRPKHTLWRIGNAAQTPAPVYSPPSVPPRFIPSCSDALMTGLGALQKTTGLPMQSHLSENQGEVAWVEELCPQSRFYGDAYVAFDLFGGSAKTIMAHCVLSGEASGSL